MSLPDYDPIFGEAAAAWDEAAAAGGCGGGAPLPPFFFYVKVTGVSRIEAVASDFHSHAWSRVFGSTQLEDMKDDIGFGGSCADLVEYLASSLSFGIVKLVLSGLPNSMLTSGVVHAKLIAQKFEGMPRIPLSLSRLTGPSAKDAMSDFSIALFDAYKRKHNDVVKEQERSLRITKFISSEQEKREVLQRKLVIHSYEPRKSICGSISYSSNDKQSPSEPLQLSAGSHANGEMPTPSAKFKDTRTLTVFNSSKRKGENGGDN